jgi:hypothetical protein
LLTQHYGDDYKTRDEIENRAGGDDYKALPNGLFAKAPFVLGLLVLALHINIAAHRKESNSVEGVAFFLFENGGTHAYGKLVDLNIKKLRENEMSYFMDGDYKTEKEDGKKYGPCFGPKLSYTKGKNQGYSTSFTSAKASWKMEELL